jgi:hypothetical protein
VDQGEAGGMHVKVDWKEPIQLTRHKTLIIEEKELLAQVEAVPGIYFLGLSQMGNYPAPIF